MYSSNHSAAIYPPINNQCPTFLCLTSGVLSHLVGVRKIINPRFSNLSAKGKPQQLTFSTVNPPAAFIICY